MASFLVAKTKVKHLIDVDIVKILDLAKGNISQRKIASFMKYSQKTIQYTLAIYLFETFSRNQFMARIQMKNNKQEDNDIMHALKKNYDIPLHDIINIIDLSISEYTIRWRWSKARLESYITVKKSGLRPENVKERLDWALHYKN